MNTANFPTITPSTAVEKCPLPFDIQLYILDVLINAYHAMGADSPSYATTLLPLMLVCKPWNSYARQQIYKRVYLGRTYFYFKFAKHLESDNGKGLRKLIKEIVIELNENEDCEEVLCSNVIQTIFKLCRRIRTMELRCLWVDAPNETHWNDRLAEAVRVYANPVRFIFNHPTSCSFQYTSGLLGGNLLTYMSNLQRVDLYIEPNPAVLARKLAELEIPYMNIRVFLETDDFGDIEYTPANELASTDADEHIICPVEFFKIVATNPHLKRLEIVSRQDPRQPKGGESKSEEEIIKWIAEREKENYGLDRDTVSFARVTIHREYPSVEPLNVGRERMLKKQEKSDIAARKKLLEEFKTTYPLIYQHESDEDPSDSEWEQDTNIPLPKRLSNRGKLPPMPDSSSDEAAMGF